MLATQMGTLEKVRAKLTHGCTLRNNSHKKLQSRRKATTTDTKPVNTHPKPATSTTRTRVHQSENNKQTVSKPSSRPEQQSAPKLKRRSQKQFAKSRRQNKQKPFCNFIKNRATIHKRIQKAQLQLREFELTDSMRDEGRRIRTATEIRSIRTSSSGQSERSVFL